MQTEDALTRAYRRITADATRWARRRLRLTCADCGAYEVYTTHDFGGGPRRRRCKPCAWRRADALMDVITAIRS